MKKHCKDPHRQRAVDKPHDKRVPPSPGLIIEAPPKETGSEPLYRVVYVIDIGALNPRQAAERAHEIMRDPASMRPVLHVMDSSGRDQVVDLATSDAQASSKSGESQEKARRFVLAGATQCPVCDGEDIDFGTVELDAQCAYQEASCSSCQVRFYAMYRLVGYGLHSGSLFEVHTIAEDFGEITDDAG